MSDPVNQALAAAFEHAQAVRDAHLDYLQHCPGVVSTGISITTDGRACILCFIDTPDGGAGCPIELDGVPVRVKYSGPIVAALAL